MKHYISLSLCLIAAASICMVSCDKSDSNPDPDYTGVYEITLTGTFEDVATVIVNDNGTFSFSLTDDNGAVFNIDGTVHKTNGAVKGSVFWGTLKASDALTGTFNANGTGSGSYNAFIIYTGGWTARKK